MSETGLNKPDGLLIDLDGTLYHGSRRIEGADEWIASLYAAKLPFLFVTNNSSATPQTVAQRLEKMGIPASPEQICTSAQAAAAYIANLQPGASVYVIGEEGLRSSAADSGLQLTQEQADFVLQGIDRDFNYKKLEHAVRLIHGGARYILTNPDLLLPTEDGLSPGAGSLAAMLRAAGRVEPTVIGKPSSVLVNFALDRLGLTAERTWMIGDNMATDIAAGKAAGCGTALVLTGITTKDNMQEHIQIAGVEADQVFEDLRQLHSYISHLIRT
ncbi:TIGR01457 family HAD-type hydrolase [Paenibacillus abyssi]|uniref:Acid sugar phosphatase n=1 Tax=Paenibacillus abyssi TaxID=1340531 RepID=A0A917FLI5_9BACL|nr:TIGR01457 family HAD-type hydrolase [Paenibacillus abyssi]GGF89855.1 acid sugar phosphatase [Paenibacillus abyssi]